MLTFWQIYLPVFAAGVSSFIVAGSIHMSIGYYFHKKQQRHQKEFEAKVASGEIDPLGVMSGGMFNMEEHEFPVDRFARPTVSGQKGPNDGTGQYL